MRKLSINTILSYVSLVPAVAFIFLLLFKTDMLLDISSWYMWSIYLLISIPVYGAYVRLLHMSRIKLETLNSEEEYHVGIWRSEDLGVFYFYPLFLEAMYNRNIKPFIEGMISAFKESEESEDDEEEVVGKVPFLITLSYIINKLRLLPLSGAFTIFALFVLPRMLNDYSLYRGLTHEQLKMVISGLAIVLESIFLAIQNYSALTYVELETGRKQGKWFMATIVIISLYTVAMIILTLIFGITNFTLPVLTTVINLNIINLFIVIAPILNIVQAIILTRTYSLYQYKVNSYL